MLNSNNTEAGSTSYAQPASTNIKTPHLSITFIDDFQACLRLEAPFTPYLSGLDDFTPAESAKLSDDDREFFEALNADMKDGWEIAKDAVSSLAIIKEDQLYRETHPSFAAYCLDVFGMEHIHGGNAAMICFEKNFGLKLEENDDQVTQQKSQNDTE